MMDSDLTVTDFFCGMGGSSSGLVKAGWTVKFAANHWDRAIETHAANHPNTEHHCGDIQALDLRYLPRTRALWASPICTELSPSGGRKKPKQASLFEEYGHVPAAAYERTRMTFWEVIRATEIHRYEVIFIENVVEAAQWELFDIWLVGMLMLGYQVQFASVSAAHAGGEDNDPAAQWRDRMYMLFTRKGMRQPDLEPRPWAWCEKCGDNVQALQWWKRPGRTIGKYRQQYIYVCPIGDHGQVEPYVMPAITAIDLTDPGQRIGDRKEPLKPTTMKRIQRGLETISVPFTVPAGGTWRTMPEDLRNPMPTRLTRDSDGLVMAEPFLTMLRRNGRSTPLSEPAATFTGGGFHHGLTIPGAFLSAHHGGYADSDQFKITNSLVIPYRRGASPYRVEDGPLSTVATREQHGVLSVGIPKIEDCYFRMLSPRESANSQRFDREYVILGNQGEQQMQAGNAVAVNVAQWIGTRTAAVM